MARCAAEDCGRWRPEVLVRRGVGTYVDGQWFCGRQCVEQLARRRLIDAKPVAAGIPGMPPMRLGALLRHHGVCDAHAIERALEAQRGSRLRLGEQLFAMGVADSRGVLKALAAQAGVGYLADIDTEWVCEAPGGLSPHAVRALGLVPVSEVEDGRIRVACQAPVPRRAMSALRRLTGWLPEAYLVSDADFQRLLNDYGRDVQGSDTARSLTEFSQTASLTDAAARIAEAATRGGDTNLTEVCWEPYTWVRVQGGGKVEDVVYSKPVISEEEASCLVATTSH